MVLGEGCLQVFQKGLGAFLRKPSVQGLLFLEGEALQAADGPSGIGLRGCARKANAQACRWPACAFLGLGLERDTAGFWASYGALMLGCIGGYDLGGTIKGEGGGAGAAGRVGRDENTIKATRETQQS